MELRDLMEFGDLVELGYIVEFEDLMELGGSLSRPWLFFVDVHVLF